MMSSTMRTSSPSIVADRSFRIRTSPDDSVVVPPYELTSIRSIRTGTGMARIRSALNGSYPLRADRTVSRAPELQHQRPEVAGVEEFDADVGIQLVDATELAVLLADELLAEGRHLEIEVEVGQPEIRREALDDHTVQVPQDRERVGLVLPADPVEVEDPAHLGLAGVGERRHGSILAPGVVEWVVDRRRLDDDDGAEVVLGDARDERSLIVSEAGACRPGRRASAVATRAGVSRAGRRHRADPGA